MTPQLSQLEESNRTLTVDVANLAGEKEELNNQLKEMQQRECTTAADGGRGEIPMSHRVSLLTSD